MIGRTYLQWVGTGSYPTIEDFVAEVRAQGHVAMRLPNVGVARRVAEPGVAVFLVHDQGVARQCPACAEPTACPTCGGADQDCRRCKGLGAVEVGTGGHVEVDGARWDYLRWVRLRKNPKHPFWQKEHEVREIRPCEACGGRASIPVGAVFGVYAPHKVVEVGSDRFPVFAKWELRKKPGLYAIARYHGKVTPLAPALRKLARGEVDFFGQLGLLKEPLGYHAKHFRGLKRWKPLTLDDVEP